MTQDKHSASILWVLYFCLSMSMALIFQNVIIPNMPSVQGSGKLLAHDAVHFDSVAWNLAEKIRENGWHEWKLFVDYSSPGNVGILAAIYAIGGHDPSLIVPINAALHALSGVMIFLICYRLSDRRNIGLYAGVLASSLFITFPSSLSWYGQLHKDSYAISGTLLLLWSWLKVSSTNHESINIKNYIVTVTLSSVLIGIVRPYGLVMHLAFSMLVFIIVLVFGAIYFNKKRLLQKLKLTGIIVVVLLIGVLLTQNFAYKVNQGINSSQTTILYKNENGALSEWQWNYSDFLPFNIEKYFAALGKTRAHIIANDQREGAGSTVDADIMPSNFLELVEYLPKAFIVASLAPFPSDWFQEFRAIKLLSSIEMFIYYLFVPGLFLLFLYNRNTEVIFTSFYTITFLTILGFTMANLGTLYRMRYGYLFILLMLGSLGWFYFLERLGAVEFIRNVFGRWRNEVPGSVILENSESLSSQRKRAIGTSVLVIALTFIGFVGFFLRDWVLAHMYGVDESLDLYFISLLIPMTLVTVICMPLGVALTPLIIDVFHKQGREKVQKLLTSLSFWVSGVLLIITILLALCTPTVLSEVFSLTTQSSNSYEINMTYFTLPILLFSGVLIIGNASLNAMGMATYSSSSQLMVPLIALLSIFILGTYYGVLAAILGMFFGQLVNLVLVQYFLSKQGLSIIPKLSGEIRPHIKAIISRYIPLVVASLFSGAVIFINTSLASSNEEGAVSVFSLGNKLILLFSGLVGAAITSVILPYMSKMISKNHLGLARKELSIFMIIITVLIVPICAGLYAGAGYVVTTLFYSGSLDESELATLTRVMQYASIQMPFSASVLLLVKFSIATRHVLLVFFVSCLGLAVNYASTHILMSFMSTPGIALGLSLSFVLVAISLVLLLFIYGHFELVDVSVILLMWILFLTLMVCINFDSLSGTFFMALAFITLSYRYLRMSLSQSAQSQTGF